MMAGLAPKSAMKNAVLRRLGFKVGPGASIGPSLFVNIREISIGPHARIGPFNVFRDLELLSLGAHGRVGQWNWISCSAELVRDGGSGKFELGDHSALTSRHYLDCSGGIAVGQHTTIAGVRSTFITHGIDWKLSVQKTAPIVIGSYCLISSNASVTPGTVIADRVVTGMGATLAGSMDSPNSLYIADRATVKKSQLYGRYFMRTRGYVLTRGAQKLADDKSG